MSLYDEIEHELFQGHHACHWWKDFETTDCKVEIVQKIEAMMKEKQDYLIRTLQTKDQQMDKMIDNLSRITTLLERQLSPR